MKKKINVTIKIIANDYSNNDLFIERLLKTDHDKLGTIYPTPPLGKYMTQGQFLSGV